MHLVTRTHFHYRPVLSGFSISFDLCRSLCPMTLEKQTVLCEVKNILLFFFFPLSNCIVLTFSLNSFIGLQLLMFQIVVYQQNFK